MWFLKSSAKEASCDPEKSLLKSLLNIDKIECKHSLCCNQLHEIPYFMQFQLFSFPKRTHHISLT